MYPMWLCIISCKCSEDAFANTQWRKAEEMQPMWICLLWSEFLQETFEKAQWRKFNQIRPMCNRVFQKNTFLKKIKNKQPTKHWPGGYQKSFWILSKFRGASSHFGFDTLMCKLKSKQVLKTITSCFHW